MTYQANQSEDVSLKTALHPNHLPDLRYVLMVLEKARKHQPFDEQERQELAAATTGMRYIIKRTEEAAALPAATHPETP